MGDLENKYPASKHVQKTKLMHTITAENSLRVVVPSTPLPPAGKTGGPGTGRRFLPPVSRPGFLVRLYVGCDIKQRQAAQTPNVVFVVASHYQSLQVLFLLLQACLFGSMVLSRTLLLQQLQ